MGQRTMQWDSVHQAMMPGAVEPVGKETYEIEAGSDVSSAAVVSGSK